MEETALLPRLKTWVSEPNDFMKNKAQILGQVFTYILAIMLAAMILLFGYNAIFGKDGFLHRTEQIALTSLKTEIEREIKNTASDPGRIKRLELSLPSKYRKICFVDLKYVDKTSTCLCSNQNSCAGSQDYNPTICNAWQDQTQNIFLVPMADIEITTGKLRTKIATGCQIDASDTGAGYICLPVVSSKAVIRIEGCGDMANIYSW